MDLLRVWLCLLSAGLSSVGAFPLSRGLVEDAEAQLEPYRRDPLLQRSLTLSRKRRERHRRRKLNNLKHALQYLRVYGYLDAGAPLTPRYVGEALTAFQRVAGVDGDASRRGDLSDATVRAMRQPRCGNRDIDTPQTGTARVKRFTKITSWTGKVDENDVLQLKWFIEKYTKDIPKEDIRAVVKRAFKLWSDQTGVPSMRTISLNFQEADSKDASDINILWALGNHGDKHPFDDGGDESNVLAHTFYPGADALNGDIHMDDFEHWLLDNSNGEQGSHFPYVMVHEIGHSLGLGHSMQQDAVMNPIYKKVSLDTVQLALDDRCALNWNYVGESQMCFYIWLLVELLPRTRNHTTAAADSNSVASSSVSSNGGDGVGDLEVTFEWNDENLQQRLNATLADLQKTKIPVCTSRNDVQLKYEVLLEHKMEFSQDTAKRYGPVVCNFLDGLSRELRLTAGNAVDFADADDNSATDDDGVGLLTVHAYHRHTDQSPAVAGDDDFEHQRPLDDSAAATSRTRRQTDNAVVEQKRRTSIFDADYFDHDFFQRLLTLYVTDGRGRTSDALSTTIDDR